MISFSKTAFFLLILINLAAFGQTLKKPVLKIESLIHDYAEVSDISSLLSEFSIVNAGDAALYILKADAPRGFIVDIKKRILAPGDSTILSVRFKPGRIGFFNETIKLYSNAGTAPIPLTVKGLIKSLAKDPMACYSFNTKERTSSLNPLLVMSKVKVINSLTRQEIPGANVMYVRNNQILTKGITSSNGTLAIEIPLGLYHIEANAVNYYPSKKQLYINKNSPDQLIELQPIPSTPSTVQAPTKLQPVFETKEHVGIDTSSSELSEDLYNANNVVFLIDISGSMKDSLKLPLLKLSINKLISALRSIDQIAIVTYSDSARIFVPATQGNKKNKLISSVNSLRAKGNTAGSQGISMAYDVIKKNYIEGGNNQIILATDGIFKLSSQNEKLLASDSLKTVNLSILGFGTDKWSLDKLRILAKKNNGNFMMVNNEQTTQILLDEIKIKSKK